MFKTCNEVFAAVQELLDQVEASGFEVDVFEDLGQTHCIRTVPKGARRLRLNLPGTNMVNKPANPV